MSVRLSGTPFEWSWVRVGASKLFVLGALGGLGFWGQVHHWKVPKFSSLFKSSAADPPHAGFWSGTEPAASSDKKGPRVLTFRSRNSIEQAGLESAAARSQALDEFVVANGTITYDENRVARLAFRVPGTVWRVDKMSGQTVSKGDVLAILDAHEVGKAKAEFLQTAVDAQVKAQTVQRLRSVGGSVPERQLREAEAEFREAKIRRFNAQQALINLGLAIHDLNEKLSDEQLASAIHFLGLPPGLIRDLPPDQTTANLLPLVAPFEGVVIDREVVMGEVVEPSQTQFVVADVRKMWIQLDVRREDARRLRIGQEVLFESDAVGASIRSTLTWISTELQEKTRTVRIRAEVDNPVVEPGADGFGGQRLLRAHAFGTGHIRVRSQPAAILIESRAVQWHHEQPVVFIPLSDGRSFEARPVRVGFTDRGLTEVLEGVAAGESVVTAGSHLLEAELSRRYQTAVVDSNSSDSPESTDLE